MTEASHPSTPLSPSAQRAVAHVLAAAPEHRPATAIGWASGAVRDALRSLDRGDLDEVRAALIEAAAVLATDVVFGSGGAR